ncbi:MAG: CotH kinase family protein, partial [Bacteroidota bacterium]
NYLGSNPDDYKISQNGQRVYDLRTNTEVDDYSDLANFISILNLTSLADLPCELEDVFNVDNYLKIMAVDVLTGNWDGYAYNKNNFYLYHNTYTDKFEFIPYDLDNTLGINWLSPDWTTRDLYDWPPSNQSRPLFERLLEVEDYRARYTYYLTQILEQYFNSSYLFPEFDAIHDRIAPFVENDTYYPLDYGFDFDDFTNGFNSSTNYGHTEYSLKTFLALRRSNAFNQLESLDMNPILRAPRAIAASVGQELSFQIQIEDDNAINEVRLCYQVDGGSENCTTMFDNGEFGDGQAADGEYGAFVAALASAGVVTWYYTATDADGNTGRHPVCGDFALSVNASGLGLAINEFMASNDATVSDPVGEYDDWVEIHNYSGTNIDLDGFYLSDDSSNPTKWAFPDVSIPAGDFLLVWADDDEEQGQLHTSFKLNADGEYIGIYGNDASNNILIDGIEFGPQETDAALGRLPNGTGAFQAVLPTPGGSNLPLATQQIVDPLAVQLFPNPARGPVNLRSPETGHFTVVVVDALGRQQWQGSWQGASPLQLNSANWPAGLYHCQVWEESQLRFVEKVVVIR